MKDSIDEVLEFFGEWDELDTMRAAIRSRFTPDTIWESVGLSKVFGANDAIEFLDAFVSEIGAVRGEVAVHYIAATAHTVLTERTDCFVRSDGTSVAEVRLMGIFEMDGPKILRWRDYFDTRSFAG